ncbi:MAG: substrate-binding domain-containing protein, partial [Cyanobacteria bacterium J06632_3]
MMRANRYTLAKLCLLTALAVPVQRAAFATVSLATPQANAKQLLLAQNNEASIVLPDSLEGEDTLLIDGSSSMRSMNTALTEQFQERYPEANVDSEFNGSDIAVQRLIDGEIDLAAIGRPLTEEEEAAGLSAVPIAREKIAIIVGPDNPFEGDITFLQFGDIFRGDITDWSELDGEAGSLRFVDRPDTSDTRKAFRPYPVFQEAAFETGTTADPVGEDETDAVVEALGNDGIGYAIANQVMGRDDVKIISMHQTLPDEAAYPFSQPRNYVYSGEASPAIAGFLGVATSEEGEAVVQAVQDAEGAAAVEIEGTPPVATSPDGQYTARTNEENLAIIEDADGNPVGAPLIGAGGAVTALAFSPDSQTLATGTNDGKVRYWGVDGEPKSDVFQPITGDDAAVSELNFEENDKLFVGGSQGRQGFWGLNGLPFGETAAAGGAA